MEGKEATRASKLAENSAAFIRGHLYDEIGGELRRSWREGPGPQGQADDYAFLIQGGPSALRTMRRSDRAMNDLHRPVGFV